MWYKLTDKSIIFPSSSTIILLMDIDENEHSPFKYTIMPVGKVLEICDKPYYHWTHWMEIPSTKSINEKKLDELAKEFAETNRPESGNYGYIYTKGYKEGFKAGYHKAMKE